MKRSFYEMLGVARNADLAQIDAAYATAMERLNAEDVRGNAEAVNEAQLLRDGYQILSDPEKRVRYNANLAASDAGVKLMFFPEDSVSRRKLGVQTVIFAALSAIFGAVVYAKLTQKVDETLVEQKRAIARQRGVSNPPVTTKVAPPDTPDAPRSDTVDAKAGGEKQKR